ncbi:alpha/beta hydrolase [Phormidium sp. LEGE 05292]|uniref:alpha/beta hydrolase n=1 Tax=[Phormidium] sp. LEGE 05292 TaxID=767427 RepID=UPI001882C1E2|nr:alpha/beta hydrolase-fold protein [Phormidium sp. LEGE 05292]MBE9229103.1 alpha/beta hydrolase [Phormidium sp. LEGE 05292]
MGEIQIIRDFYSFSEQTNRTLRIFTPDAYHQEPYKRFPVLYMLDGQNIFSHPESAVYDTWCANIALEELISEGTIHPWIIVGIDHLPNRMEEYSPWQDGRGHLTSEFLVNSLKPYIDRQYRTLTDPQNTAILGSSMGGLFALYIGKTYPQLFGRIGGISPALMFGGDFMFRYWDRHTRFWSKILLYVGSAEQYNYYGTEIDFVPINKYFYQHLKNLGYSEQELYFVLGKDEIHHETAWQKRLPEMLTWLLESTVGTGWF